jgi:transcriptional regulator with XRE-family HTH domain
MLPSLPTFCDRLSYLIKMSDLRQSEVAAKLDVGQSHISGIRNGKSSPSRELISKIAIFFECSEEWLVYGTGVVKSAGPDIPKGPRPLDMMYEEIERIWGGIPTNKERFTLQTKMFNLLEEFEHSESTEKDASQVSK